MTFNIGDRIRYIPVTRHHVRHLVGKTGVITGIRNHAHSGLSAWIVWDNGRSPGFFDPWNMELIDAVIGYDPRQQGDREEDI